MPKGKSALTFLFFLIVALAGCDQVTGLLHPKEAKKSAEIAAMPKGVIVAKAGNFYITLDDLNKEIESYNSFVAAQKMDQYKIDTREKKITYLRNELIRKYVLYQEALDRGLDKRDDIAKAVESAKREILVGELDREEKEKISVTSKDVEDFYNQNRDTYFKDPEQRKVSEIVTPTEDEAKQVMIELLKGTDFSALARQYSKGSTAADGGSVGFLNLDPDPKKRTRFDKYYEIAYSLEKGNTSTIFKGPDGYYIVRLDEVKKAEIRPLNDVWDNIKNMLTYERQQKAISDLASKLSGENKIEIYEGKVE